VIVTDPPYGLEFMGKEWDCLGRINSGRTRKQNELTAICRGPESYVAGAPMQEWHYQWASHLLGKAGWLFAFGGTRTWHRLACAIEDAGWQYRDTIMWLYGQGFPKGKNNLKPAWEPILVARKYGDLDIDAARIEGKYLTRDRNRDGGNSMFGTGKGGGAFLPAQGRWPANLVLDEEAGRMLDEQSGELVGAGNVREANWTKPVEGYGFKPHPKNPNYYANHGGGASRFFYCAKASRKERGDGNDHPTVKPLKLMEWLIKLSGGQLILDPFMGSGTTLVAAKRLVRKAIGIELDEHSCEIAAKRCQSMLV
jgi:site-specific DNA-methyltransferase (adenine-specific)